jgi:hypothetical protein
MSQSSRHGSLFCFFHGSEKTIPNYAIHFYFFARVCCRGNDCTEEEEQNEGSWWSREGESKKKKLLPLVSSILSEFQSRGFLSFHSVSLSLFRCVCAMNKDIPVDLEYGFFFSLRVIPLT